MGHQKDSQLLLVLQVENLNGPRLGPQGDDLTLRVHDSTVGLDRPPDHIIAILQLDDDDFGSGGFVLLLSNADEGVRFKCLSGHSQSTPRQRLEYSNTNT